MRRKYIIISLIIIVLNNVNLFSQTTISDSVFMKKSLMTLASESMKGRFPGSIEDKKAADFIADKLSEHGYVAYFKSGMLAPFSFTKNRSVQPGAMISLKGVRLSENIDFSIPPFSPDCSVKSEIVDGNGQKTVDYKGKFVKIKSAKDSIRFIVTELADKGAVGVIYYLEGVESLDDSKTGTAYQMRIPVVQVRASVATKMNDGDSFEADYKVKPIKETTYNVIAILKAQNSIGTILIGAHYDHLGMGGKETGSMRPDRNEIHYGADDNASGVSAIIEIGRLLAKSKKELKYDVVIAAFGAEERGLLGSSVLADTLAKLDKRPTIMFNLDMVGRMVGNKFQVGGVGTFKGADSLTDVINRQMMLGLTKTKDGMGPSDHASFYNKGVPVLYFTTGVHQQYHTPDDKESLINYTGMTKAVDYIYSIAFEIASGRFAPQFTKSESDRKEPQRSTFKVTLGLIPDFTYEVGDGFRISAVSDGKPAQKAGLLAGDIIKSINGKVVGNIYDYMSRLGELKQGELVEVVVKREGKESIFKIQL